MHLFHDILRKQLIVMPGNQAENDESNRLAAVLEKGDDCQTFWYASIVDWITILVFQIGGAVNRKSGRNLKIEISVRGQLVDNSVQWDPLGDGLIFPGEKLTDPSLLDQRLVSKHWSAGRLIHEHPAEVWVADLIFLHPKYNSSSESSSNVWTNLVFGRSG